MKTDRKILTYTQVKKISRQLKRQNKKIILVTGCFDILHAGHLIFLNYAKNKGDILFVALGDDKNTKKLKGDNRPLLNEKLRSRILAALEITDFVVICHEPLIGNIEHAKLVAILKPDFYVVPITDKNLENKRKMVQKAGGKLLTCRRHPPNHLRGGVSTTKIEQKLLNL